MIDGLFGLLDDRVVLGIGLARVAFGVAFFGAAFNLNGTMLVLLPPGPPFVPYTLAVRRSAAVGATPPVPLATDLAGFFGAAFFAVALLDAAFDCESFALDLMALAFGAAFFGELGIVFSLC